MSVSSTLSSILNLVTDVRTRRVGQAQFIVRNPQAQTLDVQGLIDEMNLARRNPRAYAEIIRREEDDDAETREAIAFLNRVTPCTNTLTLVPGLSVAARALVAEQSVSGDFGHGDFLARLQSAGTYRRAAENIAYGINVPRDIVIQWIVDRGIPDRGHRNNLFNCVFTQIGIGYGTHPMLRNMTVVDYASDFVARR